MVLVPLIAVAFAGCDDPEPQNYDDCILKNMRGVTSNVAAAEIRRSCRQKFPDRSDEKPESTEMDSSELAALTGRARLMYANVYGGNVYNGTKDTTVTQLRIKVTTKEDGKEVFRIYTADVTIPPHSAKDFSFDIILGDKGADYSWDIDGAMGY